MKKENIYKWVLIYNLMMPEEHDALYYFDIYSRLIGEELELKKNQLETDSLDYILGNNSLTPFSDVGKLFVEACKHYDRLTPSDKERFSPVLDSLTNKILPYFPQEGLLWQN